MTQASGGEFLSDIQAIRARARQHIEQGAVTANYAADRETVLRLLNEALATELVCTLRYKRHYFMATGIHSEAAAAEFLEHASRNSSMPTRSPPASSSWAGSRISIRRALRRVHMPNTSRAEPCAR